MKIAVIGSGRVGSVLGKRWSAAGHEVRFGVRAPRADKVRSVLDDVPGSTAHTIAEAAAPAAVVVLATPWGDATRSAVEACGDLAGKALFDCTNPLKADLSGLELGFDDSAGERVQAWAPDARVVKIFNTTGSHNMADPLYDGEASVMFYCGDDAGAKKIAHLLAAELGFDPVDAGPLRQARLLEPLAMLWISLAFGGMGPDIGLRLMRR